MAEKVPGFDTPFYRRFLNQKGGTANIFFTAVSYTHLRAHET